MLDLNNFAPGEWDDGTGGGMGPPPVGNYLGWSESFERRYSQRGDPMISFAVRIGMPEDQPWGGTPVGKTYESCTLTESGIFRLAAYCRAIGHTSQIDLTDDAAVDEALLFKPMKFRVKHETYNGKTYARIDRYLAISPEEVDRALEAIGWATGAVSDAAEPEIEPPARTPIPPTPTSAAPARVAPARVAPASPPAAGQPAQHREYEVPAGGGGRPVPAARGPRPPARGGRAAPAPRFPDEDLPF